MSLSVCRSVGLTTCLSFFVCLCTCQSVYLSVCQSVCLSGLSVGLTTCLLGFVFLCTYLSVCLSVCLPVCLMFSLSVGLSLQNGKLTRAEFVSWMRRHPLIVDSVFQHSSIKDKQFNTGLQVSAFSSMKLCVDVVIFLYLWLPELYHSSINIVRFFCDCPLDSSKCCQAILLSVKTMNGKTDGRKDERGGGGGGNK